MRVGLVIVCLALLLVGCDSEAVKKTEGNSTSESYTPVDNGEVFYVDNGGVIDYNNGNTIIECTGGCGDISITINERI